MGCVNWRTSSGTLSGIPRLQEDTDCFIWFLYIRTYKVKTNMYGKREMHKVTCADCGKETEVPFKPDGTRPVYCRDCYQKHKKPRRF